jgi:hypothetical protein
LQSKVFFIFRRFFPHSIVSADGGERGRFCNNSACLSSPLFDELDVANNKYLKAIKEIALSPGRSGSFCAAEEQKKRRFAQECFASSSALLIHNQIFPNECFNRPRLDSIRLFAFGWANGFGVMTARDQNYIPVSFHHEWG